MPKNPATVDTLEILGATCVPHTVYHLRRAIIELWKANGIANYLFYREVAPNTPYRLNAIPIQENDSPFLQNMQILFWTVFGSLVGTSSPTLPYGELGNYLSSATKVEEVVKGNDCPFCDSEKVTSQQIFAGRTVSLLYNLSPLCMPHFLIVPHAHRKTALDVTEEEYVESEEIITKLIDYFKSIGYPFAYIFDRTGALANQTVPHFHIQVAFAASRTGELFGKFLVLQRTLIGKSNLSASDLQQRVTYYSITLHFTLERQTVPYQS